VLDLTPIIDLARAQDGVLTNAQAAELGLTPSARRNVIQRHGWRQPFYGVLFVPQAAKDVDQSRARAAALRFPNGFVSLRSAARYWHLEGLLLRNAGEAVSVTLPRNDPLSQKLIEALVRLPLVDAGIGPLISQYEVTTQSGILLAAIDLALSECRIALEADGRAGHDNDPAFVWDRRRDVLLADEGWIVIRFSWLDALRPVYVVQTVTRAIERVRRQYRLARPHRIHRSAAMKMT
jgi:very-short-patch-repair endonuclease